jgi:hypothetical protein
MADINQLWQEYQATKQAAQGVVTAAPRSNFNANAAQKGAETEQTEQAKQRVAQEYQDLVRNKIGGSLGAVSENIETMNKEGGYSPLYDNEELLFGVLPGVKPTVQFLRSQGMGDLPVIGDVGKSLTNRETMRANSGQLAAQLKQVIRQPGEGVWTDADQRFLMQMLPSGEGYETDKNIISSLQNGTLLKSLNDYRNSGEWKAGLEQNTQETNPQNWNVGVQQMPATQDEWRIIK